MSGNTFEKSHIHILSRASESAQEIVDSIPCNCESYTYVYHLSTLIYSWCRGKIYKNRGFYLEGAWLWRISGLLTGEW